jgi:hypothetical protein
MKYNIFYYFAYFNAHYLKIIWFIGLIAAIILVSMLIVSHFKNKKFDKNYKKK